MSLIISPTSGNLIKLGSEEYERLVNDSKYKKSFLNSGIDQGSVSPSGLEPPDLSPNFTSLPALSSVLNIGSKTALLPMSPLPPINTEYSALPMSPLPPINTGYSALPPLNNSMNTGYGALPMSPLPPINTLPMSPLPPINTGYSTLPPLNNSMNTGYSALPMSPLPPINTGYNTLPPLNNSMNTGYSALPMSPLPPINTLPMSPLPPINTGYSTLPPLNNSMNTGYSALPMSPLPPINTGYNTLPPLNNSMNTGYSALPMSPLPLINTGYNSLPPLNNSMNTGYRVNINRTSIVSPSSPSISLSYNNLPPIIPLKTSPIVNKLPELNEIPLKHIDEILTMPFYDIPTLEKTLTKTNQPSVRARIQDMIDEKRENEGRGLKTRGWSSRAPTRGKERHQIMNECGAKCFLHPGEKFPICPSPRMGNGKSICKIDCGGVQAAKIRAAQWGYEDVEAKADKILKECNTKGLSAFSPLPPLSSGMELAGKMDLGPVYKLPTLPTSLNVNGKNKPQKKAQETSTCGCNL